MSAASTYKAPGVILPAISNELEYMWRQSYYGIEMILVAIEETYIMFNSVNINRA